MGISFSVLAGCAGLAIDLGRAYVMAARLQKIADAAAMAGALGYLKNGSTTALMTTVTDVVVANGWTSSIIQQTSGAAMLVTSPHVASNSAVQVTLVGPTSMTLGHLVTNLTSLSTQVSAYVELAGSSGPVCLLALSQSTTIDSTEVLNACAFADNSTSSSAIIVNSSGNITTAGLITPGGITNNGLVNGITGLINPALKPGASPVADPYAKDVAAANALNTNCQNYNNQTTLTPGCWQNVNVNSGTLRLQSGAYYFPSINVNSGGTLDGSAAGTTIVVGGGFSPSGPVLATAPTTGPLAGLGLVVLGGDLNINSSNQYAINGGVYVPNGRFNPNSATWNQNDCTYVVAAGFGFNSGNSFTLPQANCAGYIGTAAAASSGGKPVLVQ